MSRSSRSSVPPPSGSRTSRTCAGREAVKCQIGAGRRDPVDMEIEEVLLVRSVELRQTRNGSPFLRMTLGTRSSTLPAVLWAADERAVEVASQGAPVHF